MSAAHVSEQKIRNWWRWLGPLAATTLLIIVVFVIHRELTRFSLHDVARQLRAIPTRHLLMAALLTAASYFTLTCYDALGLHYLRRRVAYSRSLFTSFIAYAFGHNLSLGALTGAAIRFRLYGSSGLTGTEVATLSGFCSSTSGLGLASLAAISLLFSPDDGASVLHVHRVSAWLVSSLLISIIVAYLAWAMVARCGGCRVVESQRTKAARLA